MLLSRLAETRIALAGTRSRNAKRDLIATVLRDASRDDVEIVVSYLSGSLRQRRTGVGWRALQSIPPPAEEASLSVGEVDAAFEYVASLSGTGSTAARAAAVDALLARATADEQDLLRGLVFGELRQGAMEAAVQEGLAAAFEVPLAAVRRAAMLMSSTTGAAALLLTGGLEALQAVGLQVGVAIQPMLAASAPVRMPRWPRRAFRQLSTTSWTAYACRYIGEERRYGSSPAAWTTSPRGFLR